ncbi:hypothetical protein [Yoonia sp.]
MATAKPIADHTKTTSTPSPASLAAQQPKGKPEKPVFTDFASI